MFCTNHCFACNFSYSFSLQHSTKHQFSYFPSAVTAFNSLILWKTLFSPLCSKQLPHLPHHLCPNLSFLRSIFDTFCGKRKRLASERFNFTVRNFNPTLLCKWEMSKLLLVAHRYFFCSLQATVCWRNSTPTESQTKQVLQYQWSRWDPQSYQRPFFLSSFY